jgi:D-beta-D-heptose 7-phosphate kinase/D-beta-D-heptose 1-phosphate adenosyltransferase
VSGAGDTYTSALTLALAVGAQGPAAADIASAAASVVVSKDGTSTCTGEELREYLLGHGKYMDDVSRLRDRARSYREQGKRVVFTNGCFDILHRGHVTYLSHAKMLGDVLIVAVNSDASVGRMKGPTRPIVPLEDRLQVLAAMSCVDHVIAFEEDTPVALIDAVRPDVFVKGGDYTRETLPEAPLVESLGGCVEILPFVEDRSTTGIIERIRDAYAHSGGR